MPDATDPTASSPPVPAILGGDALYDQIMQFIDPELTTAGLPTLEEKYRGETPEQAAERAKRYKAAFDEYERRYAAYGAQWMEQFSRYQRLALATLEHADRASDEKAMQDVEARITNS